MSTSMKLVGKRLLASATMASTVLSMAGFAAFAPVTALAVAPADYGLREGDTISASGSSDPDIYIVNDWGYKRLFVNPAIFNLYGHLGWDKVKSVAPATRDAFGTSGLFRNCESGDAKVYGLDVISEDVANLRWINTSGAQAVADDANFFKKVFCINNNEQALYGVGAEYTSVLQVPVYTRVPGSTPAPTGSVMASLSSHNPASSTLVAGSTDATSQGRADLAHFTFSGNGTVTNLKLKRIGVSADTTLENVYLYDGEKRLTDAASVTNSEITFNDAGGLFMVSGSKDISVRADIDASTAGQTVGVQLISFNGIAASLSANLHTIASATLADLTLAASTTPSTNSSLNPADDAVVWQNTATVGTRYVWLKGVQFRVIGSVNVGDLRQFRLYVDGVQAGTAVAQTDANGYVVFDLSGSPVKMETGGRVLKVLANVVGGSSRNFTVSLRQASDINAVDSQYNVSLRPTASGNFPASSGQQTISEGTLTITKKSDSPSGDVVKDASGVALARYEFKANGERLKVENLRVAVHYSGAGSAFTLRNGAIFADGVQIGSTQALCSSDDTSCNGYVAASSVSYTEYSLGSSLIIEPGTPRVIEVRGDIYDSDGTNAVTANDTIAVLLQAGSSNVQKLVSLNYLSSGASTANTLTVKTGSFSSGKYTGYANQTVVTPKTGFKVGHFTLTAASSENINVNTVSLDSDTSGGTFDAADMTDVYLKVWSDTGSLVYTSPAKSTISTSASNSYSVNFTIPQNKTYQVEVYANLGSVTAADYMSLDMDASGVTANSSTAATAAEVDGQRITAQAGSLNKQATSVPAATFAAGGATKTAYAFNLQPQYDDFTLDEVYVDLSSTLASSTGAVANLTLKNGSTVIGSATVNASTASASFTGLNYVLPQAGGTKSLTVEVQLANVGIGANDTAGNVTLRLDGLKYRDSAGNITTTTGLAPASNTGNAIVVAKAYPTFTNDSSLATTGLGAGTQTLFRTTVAAVGGTVAWSNITFTVASSSNAITFTGWKLFENGVDITADATGAAASTSSDLGGKRKEFTFSVERAITSGTVLELKATLGGTIATGDSVTTQITNPKGTTVTSDDATTQQNSGASFVWSDSSAATHSSATDDWFTDGLIKTLADAQSRTK